jgi:hypothetical protein
MIAVVFHTNSEPEIVKSEYGIRFIVADLINESVSSVYFAKDKTDAESAIAALKEEK